LRSRDEDVAIRNLPLPPPSKGGDNSVLKRIRTF
jgi:hypothetical protein